jgi:hypothetical protein
LIPGARVANLAAHVASTVRGITLDDLGSGVPFSNVKTG